MKSSNIFVLLEVKFLFISNDIPHFKAISKVPVIPGGLVAVLIGVDVGVEIGVDVGVILGVGNGVILFPLLTPTSGIFLLILYCLIDVFCKKSKESTHILLFCGYSFCNELFGKNLLKKFLSYSIMFFATTIFGPDTSNFTLLLESNKTILLLTGTIKDLIDFPVNNFLKSLLLMS